MSRQHHRIKCETAFYQKVEKNEKRFEARKEDDRTYNVYDMVTLLESLDGKLTGREFGPVEIDYVLRGPAFGIESGHCVFTWRDDRNVSTQDLGKDLIGQPWGG